MDCSTNETHTFKRHIAETVLYFCSFLILHVAYCSGGTLLCVNFNRTICNNDVALNTFFFMKLNQVWFCFPGSQYINNRGLLRVYNELHCMKKYSCYPFPCQYQLYSLGSRSTVLFAVHDINFLCSLWPRYKWLEWPAVVTSGNEKVAALAIKVLM